MPSSARPRKAPLPAAAKAKPDTLTVGWMLSVVTALACELTSGGVRLLYHYALPTADTLRLLSSFLMFSALVIATISFFLGLAVLRWRTRPPQGILVFSWTVAGIPWLVALLQAWN